MVERILYEGEISFLHKERIEEIRCRNGHVLSSHAFPSLWLWRKQMGLRLYLEEELFSVKAEKYGKNTWFFPCGSEERKQTFIRNHQREEDFVLCYLGEEDRQFLERNFRAAFEFSPAPDASEYIYDRREMEDLAGGRYSNMRKQIHKLLKRYQMRVEKISSHNLKDAMKLLCRGSVSVHKPGYHFLRDEGIAEEALQNRSMLGLFGIVVYLDGEPKSFAMGFGITQDTVDGCIERHGGEISGISYLTQREFFLSAPEQYRFMNGEEDMGLPGLRTMKHHMVPARKNEIWEARLRNKGKGKGNEGETG